MIETLKVNRYREKLLYKNVGLIHCSGKLSLLERKLANCLFYYAKNRLQYEIFHKIDMKTLMSILRINTRNTKILKSSIISLMSTIIEWNILQQPSKDSYWKASTILASAEFNRATLIYEYSHAIREHISNPTMYGNICLYVQSKFKSNYSLIIYETCCRYRAIGATKWFTIEQLKKILGSGSDSYKEFSYFKKRILKKAINEINEYAKFNISVEQDKSRGWPSKIRFIIKDKVILGPERDEIFSLTNKEKNKLFKDYSEEYINEKIKFVEDYRGEVKNKKSLFISALKNNYSNNKKRVLPTTSLILDEKNKKHREYKKTISSWFYSLNKDQQKKYFSKCLSYFKKNKSNWHVHIEQAMAAIDSNNITSSPYKLFVEDMIHEFFQTSDSQQLDIVAKKPLVAVN
jgi:plasmid replication initiation protein